MEGQHLACDRIFRSLGRYAEEEFTGRIEIRAVTGECWQVYFSLGRIAWATGGQHPRRRWERQLKQARLGASIPETFAQLDRDFGDRCDCPEYHLLAQLARQRQLDTSLVVAAICRTIEEVFFDIVQSGERACFSPRDYRGDALPLEKALELAGDGLHVAARRGIRPSATERFPHTWAQSLLSVQSRVRDRWLAWTRNGLLACSPNLAPAIAQPRSLQQQVSESVFRNLNVLLNGDRTLRDLSVLISSDALQVTRSLLPHVYRGAIRLNLVDDRPPVQKAPSSIAGFGSSRGPLVACIDDCPLSRQIVEKIAIAAGYRFLGIANSSEALEKLLEYKPDLALIDLVMPIFSGYEVCKQVRCVSQLARLPLIVMSSSIADRVRARVSGANDCINKPIQVEPLVSLLRKYARVNPEEDDPEMKRHSSAEINVRSHSLVG